MPLPTYPLAFFFITVRNIYYALIKLRVKQAHVTQAYFPKSLSHALCLHYRTLQIN